MEQKIITQPLTRHSEELRSNVARIFDPNYRLHAFIYTFTNVAWQQQHGSSRVQPVFKSDPAPPKKKKITQMCLTKSHYFVIQARTSWIRILKALLAVVFCKKKLQALLDGPCKLGERRNTESLRARKPALPLASMAHMLSLIARLLLGRLLSRQYVQKAAQGGKRKQEKGSPWACASHAWHS